MKIVVQMGHVPRTSGATGTYREQEFNKLVGPRLRDALKSVGHNVTLIGADDAVPSCDVFVALHCDGNANKAMRGGSVGYPSDDSNSPSGRLASAWKRHHQAGGYPGGFHPDNYTSGLRYYYGFRKSNATFEFLAEHGTTTNPDDEAWLFSNIDACVKAHVDAIGEVVGHPIPPAPEPEPVPNPPSVEDDEMKLWLFRVENDPTIWLTDLLKKRHVKSENELNDLVYLNKVNGGKMLWTPEPGTTQGSGSYEMVRVLGTSNTWLADIPVA